MLGLRSRLGCLPGHGGIPRDQGRLQEEAMRHSRWFSIGQYALLLLVVMVLMVSWSIASVHDLLDYWHQFRAGNRWAIVGALVVMTLLAWMPFWWYRIGYGRGAARGRAEAYQVMEFAADVNMRIRAERARRNAMGDAK